MAETERVKVAVNGYGVIGKRVADAVAAQPDMDLAGVADVVTGWRARMPESRRCLITDSRTQRPITQTAKVSLLIKL